METTPQSKRLGKELPGPRLLALAALAGLAACGSPTPPHSPVIVVTIDTLRADRLSCYGYGRETSPNLDKLAAESVLFENASTTVATTLPAHVSLWTSRYPMQTGIVANDANFNVKSASGTVFFAQLMQDQGYRTAAFVSATPVKRERGLGIGFDDYDQPEEKERSAEVTTDRALAWIDAFADEPFFLWLHYFDPHSPYEPPAPYGLTFKTDDVLRDFMRSHHFALQTDPLMLEMNNQYDGEILYTDYHLQRIFDGLRDHGLYDEATIVITSDHGEGLGQRGHMGHGRIYEEQTHVPLILKLPASLGIEPARYSKLVSIVDIVPTLITNLSLPVSLDGFEGINMLSEDRDFVFAQRSFAKKEARWGRGRKFTLKTPAWKYHLSTENPDELYDMREDRRELFNRLDRDKQEAQELRERLTRFMEELEGRGAELEIMHDLTESELSDLEDLGYTVSRDEDEEDE